MHVLLHRRILVNGEWIEVPLSTDQAAVSRDGLAKVRDAAVRHILQLALPRSRAWSDARPGVVVVVVVMLSTLSWAVCSRLLSCAGSVHKNV